MLKGWTIAGLVVVVGLWGLSWALLVNDPERGAFGDMFGAVNALFSGLAFLGVIVAILMQREELQLQRADLELQRIELQLTRAEMKTQTESFRKQNFEATFFQLLRLHSDMVESISVLGPPGFSGRRALKEIWDKVYQQVAKGQFRAAISQFENQAQPQTGHYFRNLYRIVLFVHEKAEPDDKTMYMRLIRAQLSRDEALLLCGNCLSKFGKEEFKPLVEQYALLEGVEEDINPEHRGEFASSAFGGAD